MVRGIATALSGEHSLVTLIQTKGFIPMTLMMNGWVMPTGLGILWRDDRIDQLLPDQPEHYFADPTDVGINPLEIRSAVTFAGVFLAVLGALGALGAASLAGFLVF